MWGDASTQASVVSAVSYVPRAAFAPDATFSLDFGIECDYACFALWDGARSRESKIIEDIGRHFDVIGNYEIHWSKEHYRRNISRLYEINSGREEFTGWDKKIGAPPFRFIVARDNSPSYTWKRSVSGAIEPSNERIVEAKYRYRSWFDAKYQVHSSNNISEFLFQTALVLGVDRSMEVMRSFEERSEVLIKDLEGASGWESWSDLLSVLNFATRYLILRNFEELPRQLGDTDIDVLTDNYQRLASAANVWQDNRRPYKGVMRVAGADVSVDIRFIGDGYYPAPWQTKMLERRQVVNGFFAPASDDLFFSILYHCKLHKPNVNPKYIPKLAKLGSDMRFDWFNPKILDDDIECTKVLSGYMRSQALFYEDPIDEGVYRNEKIIHSLPAKGSSKMVKPTKKPVKRAGRRTRKQVSRIWNLVFSSR